MTFIYPIRIELHKKKQFITANIDTEHRCIYRYIKHINEIPKEEKTCLTKSKKKKADLL